MARKGHPAITDEAFESLLAWLDSDRDGAGRKYEIIRSGLVRVFVSHGFSDAEDLADVTINRVCDRLADIRGEYVGEPARYFHGVARNVIREARRRKEIATDDPPVRVDPAAETSDRYKCLLECLDQLPGEKRDLILDYYVYAGREKIEHHKAMAAEMGVTEGALRTRAHHIRAALEKCVLRCVNGLAEKQKRPRWTLLRGRSAEADVRQEPRR